MKSYKVTQSKITAAANTLSKRVSVSEASKAAACTEALDGKLADLMTELAAMRSPAAMPGLAALGAGSLESQWIVQADAPLMPPTGAAALAATSSHAGLLAFGFMLQWHYAPAMQFLIAKHFCELDKF